MMITRTLCISIKFLPSRKDDLFKRFNKLFVEFWQQQKYQHNNEMVAILDELLRQKFIEQETYNKLNDLIEENLQRRNMI